ncbi:hypothetical protein M7I_7550 [Glarea lozoyensis 74030]|uniref:Uncharacterized protein n=1 Tax=Glarea lozoyensis (strain ATCC 74030 / MF5533) TaxID=1104152 RepID=H0EXL3_GLAL7|nr:hypothetical protein M7I_7550 [Glarea lozoyensis 74030]
MHDMDGNHEDIESRGNGWGGVGGVDGEAVVMQIEEGDLGEKHATDDENCEDGNAAEPETKDSEGLRSQDEGMRDSNQSALQEEEVKTATRDNSLKERKDVLESIHEATGESASSSPNSSAISSTLTLPIITREHSLEEEKAQRVTPITRNLPPTNPSNPPTTLIYSPKKKIYVPISTYRLRNSLLYGVAFLELANAGDFAANVWNQIPVPAFAAVLMGIGGFFALFISYFAFYDAYLSHQNYVSLRTEREFLSSQPPTRDAKAYLNVNYREMGTELLDRTGLDIFMGFGCVMVGIGTLMAIGGANPRVFRASNLLSGYIGNAPVAAFGLINAAWSIYIFRRAQHQFTASQRLLHDEAEIQSLLRQRTRRVQLHSTVLGAIGIFAGAASLVTAEHWEGYPSSASLPRIYHRGVEIPKLFI